MIMIDIPRMAFGFCIPNHTAAMICAVLPLCWLGGERSGAKGTACRESSARELGITASSASEGSSRMRP